MAKNTLVEALEQLLGQCEEETVEPKPETRVVRTTINVRTSVKAAMGYSRAGYYPGKLTV